MSPQIAAAGVCQGLKEWRQVGQCHCGQREPTGKVDVSSSYVALAPFQRLLYIHNDHMMATQKLLPLLHAGAQLKGFAASYSETPLSVWL